MTSQPSSPALGSAAAFAPTTVSPTNSTPTRTSSAPRQSSESHRSGANGHVTAAIAPPITGAAAFALGPAPMKADALRARAAANAAAEDANERRIASTSSAVAAPGSPTTDGVFSDAEPTASHASHSTADALPYLSGRPTSTDSLDARTQKLRLEIEQRAEASRSPPTSPTAARPSLETDRAQTERAHQLRLEGERRAADAAEQQRLEAEEAERVAAAERQRRDEARREAEEQQRREAAEAAEAYRQREEARIEAERSVVLSSLCPDPAASSANGWRPRRPSARGRRRRRTRRRSASG